MTLPPVAPHHLRLLLIAGGLMVFFWLRLEDHGVSVAVVMGAILAGLTAAARLWPRITGRTLSPRGLLLRLALAGAMVGLLTAAFTALLMLLKDGFHGHLYPDYPAELIGGVLARAPAWALAGALAGLGAGLALLAIRGGSASE